MSIINFEDLSGIGISEIQLKQSSEIECFDKIFRKSFDLSKKLKTKIVNLSEELTRKGIENFIIENDYFYTLWEEVKPVENEQKKDNNKDLSSQNSVSEIVAEETDINDKIQTTAKHTKYRGVEVNKQSIELKATTKKTPLTYRGVAIEKISQEVNSQIATKAKTRTYRGVTYSD